MLISVKPITNGDQTISSIVLDEIKIRSDGHVVCKFTAGDLSSVVRFELQEGDSVEDLTSLVRKRVRPAVVRKTKFLCLPEDEQQVIKAKRQAAREARAAEQAE